MLKSGERLESYDSQKNVDTSLVDLKIVKQTERTLRVVGFITLSVLQGEDEPIVLEEEILKLKLTTKKKIQLNEYDHKTIKWLEQGIIFKEIRFKKDGRTLDVQQYRIGYRLYKYQQDQLRKKEMQIKQEFNSWKEGSELLAQNPEKSFSEVRKKGVTYCLSFINEISMKDVSELKALSKFPNLWSVEKIIKFLHFLTGFLKLSMKKADFDWKEIGASYYKQIGGSKEFDQYKNEFIEQLESVTQCPIAMLGMTSLGKITPLYFAGKLTGKYSSYEYGPVQALTDLSIAEEEYATNATTLWLVENRGILTRLAAEKNFLKGNRSLVLCVDGHLRSSHKSCIVQLLTNSNISQVILWSDYDPDGVKISKELYMAISKIHQDKVIKWVAADQSVILTWDDYEKYMEAFLKDRKMEQEEVVGGVGDWKKWINH
ncbi:Protein of unknown function C-terminus [Mesobacillus persicus]|uniref:DUF2399 domain-containing protein n=2 Tax=Mesobacillus persicus TaxID=930146 RepID=A0A1H8AUY5_9BACI|nr:Protein of unknown function C-terminus [Mesobacillus persicus]